MFFREGFVLSSSPGLHKRGAGWDMIPPEVNGCIGYLLPAGILVGDQQLTT